MRGERPSKVSSIPAKEEGRILAPFSFMRFLLPLPPDQSIQLVSSFIVPAGVMRSPCAVAGTSTVSP